MSKKHLAVLAILTLVAIPAFAKDTPKTLFPAPNEYALASYPSFNITVGDRVEVVTCKAELRLRAGEAYIGDDGMRRVDLQILDWKADGYSELLGGDLHFRMQKGVPMRDQSYVKSFQVWNADKPMDFPAHAQFAMPYELETPFGKITGLYGLTTGSITRFPPQTSVFTMKKGDTAEIVAALLPESVSSLSAAGEVTPVNVTVRPSACFHPDIPVDGGQ